MKKTSIEKAKDFKILVRINNTALIKSVTGKRGLLNIKTNQIIGEMDNYYTAYDSNNAFYYQEREIEESSEDNRLHLKETVRFYDAQKEKMLVDGWEVVKKIYCYWNPDIPILITVKSPVDGKIHIFDIYSYKCSRDTNMFDMALDDVELFYRNDSGVYLEVTINGKKGIYYSYGVKSKPSLIAPIEFDNIEKFPNMIVCTNKNQKYFTNYGEDGEMSMGFDEIVLDEKNKNIVYCKKGSRIYVYNTYFKKLELLLNEECDDIKYSWSIGDSDPHGTFCFIITQKNKKGLLKVETFHKNRKVITSKTSLLPAKYDDIEDGKTVFYPKKDGKTGLFYDVWEQHLFVEPDYDKIDALDCNVYAFYHGDRCDVYEIGDSLNLLIENCKLISLQEHGCIFEQKNSYGIFLYQYLYRFFNRAVDAIVDNYDNVRYLGDEYYEVEKKGKKGVNFNNKDIIPIEYDTIDLKFDDYNRIAYFALGKKDLGFELAKNCDNNVKFIVGQKFEEINFFEDVMALRTKTNLLIYNYKEKLLKEFPVSSQISMIYRKSNLWPNIIYVIDGNFYYYDRNHEEVFDAEDDLYITTYETETDLFEIKTFSKAEHDSFCGIIDSQKDSVGEQLLIDIFKNKRNEVRQQHSSLVLKRTPKNN